MSRISSTASKRVRRYRPVCSASSLRTRVADLERYDVPAPGLPQNVQLCLSPHQHPREVSMGKATGKPCSPSRPNLPRARSTRRSPARAIDRGRAAPWPGRTRRCRHAWWRRPAPRPRRRRKPAHVKLGKRDLRLADHDVIHPGKGSYQFQAHIARDGVATEDQERAFGPVPDAHAPRRGRHTSAGTSR